MLKELDYFRIEGACGGNQEWFPDRMMKLGGCAAVTACDSCIYFDLHKGTKLYPYDRMSITKEDYIRFGMRMKPYLKPRWSGIDSLELYIEGFGKYLSDCGYPAIGMEPFPGEQKAGEAKEAVIGQIDQGIPVPCLLLKHANALFRDCVWHWFLIAGYEVLENTCMVKAVTYGSWRWFDLKELWATGYRRKGGLILYHV